MNKQDLVDQFNLDVKRLLDPTYPGMAEDYLMHVEDLQNLDILRTKLMRLSRTIAWLKDDELYNIFTSIRMAFELDVLSILPLSDEEFMDALHGLDYTAIVLSPRANGIIKRMNEHGWEICSAKQLIDALNDPDCILTGIRGCGQAIADEIVTATANFVDRFNRPQLFTNRRVYARPRVPVIKRVTVTIIDPDIVSVLRPGGQTVYVIRLPRFIVTFNVDNNNQPNILRYQKVNCANVNMLWDRIVMNSVMGRKPRPNKTECSPEDMAEIEDAVRHAYMAASMM